MKPRALTAAPTAYWSIVYPKAKTGPAQKEKTEPEPEKPLVFVPPPEHTFSDNENKFIARVETQISAEALHEAKCILQKLISSFGIATASERAICRAEAIPLEISMPRN